MLTLSITERAQKCDIIPRVTEKLGATIGSVEDVINRSASLGSAWPAHPAMLALKRRRVNRIAKENGS
jgi:hypothetical protein